MGVLTYQEFMGKNKTDQVRPEEAIIIVPPTAVDPIEDLKEAEIPGESDPVSKTWVFMHPDRNANGSGPSADLPMRTGTVLKLVDGVVKTKSAEEAREIEGMGLVLVSVR